MRVTNPNPGRAIIATLVPDRGQVRTLEIPAGETVDVEDYVEASTLIEYGATADRDDLDAARDLWAKRNRAENSRTASAAASEAEIVARRQATVDVSTGGVDGGQLAGDRLAEAVRSANEDGAKISTSASADERREAVAAWQAKRGASTPAGDDFEVDDDGNVVLDDEGQPIPAS